MSVKNRGCPKTKGVPVNISRVITVGVKGEFPIVNHSTRKHNTYTCIHDIHIHILHPVYTFGW